MRNKADCSNKVTVFVTTIGDELNLRECLGHLRAQTITYRFEIIDHVAPMQAAFQEMHARCRTRYYVQVDEDMLLAPHAIEAMYEAIDCSPEDVAFVSSPLWDCESVQAVHGVKVYRHSIVAQFPYEDCLACDIVQMRQLLNQGYRVRTRACGGRQTCLGEHGKHYTPSSAYRRWLRLFHKQRQYQTLPWVKRHGQRLLHRYFETGKAVHLYAFLGAVAGVVEGQPTNKEFDYRERNANFEALAELFGDSDQPSRLTR